MLTTTRPPDAPPGARNSGEYLLGRDMFRWKMMRLVQRERASTLNTEKIVAFTQLTARMQSLRFAAQSAGQRQEADVSILSPADAASTPLCCQTLYLTVHLANGMLNTLVKQLPRHAVVVDFGENF
jgi:hypothetical protein